MPLVYHVLPDKNVGGAEKVVLSLAKSTEGSRFRSHLLLPEGSMLIPLLKKADISYTEYKEAKASFSLFLWFRRFFRKHPCDFLVTHGSALARLAGRCASLPVLLSFKHCAVPIGAPLFLYRFLTDATVAVSENANDYLQKFGIPPQERCLIHNGFSSVGVPDLPTQRRARNALGARDETITIGISARLTPIKGHPTAFHAIRMLPSRFELYLLGDGEEKESLKALAHTLGIETRVHFLGFRSDTAPFYQAMDAHLSCSLDSETASLSLAEGMSAGCATFASRIDGNVARVADGGAFFAPGNARELASLLSRMQEPGYAEKMHTAARTRAAELPDERKAKERFEAFLRSFSV